MVYETTIHLEQQTCAVCSCTFGVAVEFMNKRRQDGQSFYCPAGHLLVFRDTEVKKLQRELLQERQQLDQWQAEARQEKECRERAERQMRAARGQVTKIKNRVGNGVCPCCNRTFSNLHRHMQTEHPEFKKKEAQA